MKNLDNLFLTAFLAVSVSLGCSQMETKNTSAPVAGKNTSPAVTSEPAVNTRSENNAPNPTTKESISTIKWSDYDNIYNTKSNSTDIQKDSQWKNFEGKNVAWTGTVADVSEGMLGGLTLNIKMNDETLTHDIALSLKDDQKEKAMNLTKGKKINFTGKLVSYGGTVLPLTMDEGEIK